MKKNGRRDVLQVHIFTYNVFEAINTALAVLVSIGKQVHIK